MPQVRLERTLRVPADPAAQSLGELLSAIAAGEGPWRGFALHIGLGDLHLPDVGFVAVPIHLTVAQHSDEPRALEIALSAADLPSAFPVFNGTMSVRAAAAGESVLCLTGVYELPLHFFRKLVDAALMPRVAERSLENFIEEIRAACEARVNQREAEFARYHFYARTFS